MKKTKIKVGETYRIRKPGGEEDTVTVVEIAHAKTDVVRWRSQNGIGSIALCDFKVIE